MANFKEIVTKAVIGKGKKTLVNNYEFSTEEVPNTILGCWIINHNFRGMKKGELIGVEGDYDVNVWYSYDNDTKTTVSIEKFHYSENMKVNLKEDNNLTNNSEIIVRSLKQPTVTDVEIKNGKVNITVEKELGIEIVGDTKVRVSIEDEMEDYDIIESVNDDETIEKEIEEEVKENYI